MVNSLLKGERPLYVAYWGIGIPGGLITVLAMLSLVKFNNIVAWVLFSLIVTAIDLFWTISVCQCAKNVGWKGWRIIAGIVMSTVYYKHIVLIITFYFIAIKG